MTKKMRKVRQITDDSSASSVCNRSESSRKRLSDMSPPCWNIWCGDTKEVIEDLPATRRKSAGKLTKLVLNRSDLCNDSSLQLESTNVPNWSNSSPNGRSITTSSLNPTISLDLKERQPVVNSLSDRLFHYGSQYSPQPRNEPDYMSGYEDLNQHSHHQPQPRQLQQQQSQLSSQSQLRQIQHPSPMSPQHRSPVSSNRDHETPRRTVSSMSKKVTHHCSDTIDSSTVPTITDSSGTSAVVTTSTTDTSCIVTPNNSYSNIEEDRKSSEESRSPKRSSSLKRVPKTRIVRSPHRRRSNTASREVTRKSNVANGLASNSKSLSSRIFSFPPQSPQTSQPAGQIQVNSLQQQQKQQQPPQLQRQQQQQQQQQVKSSNNAPPPIAHVLVPAPNETQTRAERVEILLQNGETRVSVICVTSVLKKSSEFFRELLHAPKQQSPLKPTDKSMINVNTSRFNHPAMMVAPIVLLVDNPLSAGQYLTHWHEARQTELSEWNFDWAKLSDKWQVCGEYYRYTACMGKYLGKYLRLCRNLHWRSNPDVFFGRRVLGLRRQSTPSSATLIGFPIGRVIKSTESTRYGQLRVTFPERKKVMPPLLPPPLIPSTPPPPPAIAKAHNRSLWKSAKQSMIWNRKKSASKASSTSLAPAASPIRNPAATAPAEPLVHVTYCEGNINEPFWIEATKGRSVSATSDECWLDPDKACEDEINRLITLKDKKVLWEMVQVLTTSKHIYQKVKLGADSGSNASSLIAVLCKVEFRALWCVEGLKIILESDCRHLLEEVWRLNS